MKWGSVVILHTPDDLYAMPFFVLLLLVEYQA